MLKKSEVLQKAIPVNIVTGFLNSGKTTFLNSIFSQNKTKKICCIQLESGNVPLCINTNNQHLAILTFTKKQLDTDIKFVINGIYQYLADHHLDEIWIEWNGMRFLQCEKNNTYYQCKYARIITEKYRHHFNGANVS